MQATRRLTPSGTPGVVSSHHLAGRRHAALAVAMLASSGTAKMVCHPHCMSRFPIAYQGAATPLPGAWRWFWVCRFGTAAAA